MRTKFRKIYYDDESATQSKIKRKEHIYMEIVIYTVKEVASIIHTNTSYVYELIKKGFLPALKLGSYKVRAESLQKFLAENEGKDLTDLNKVINLSITYSEDATEE